MRYLRLVFLCILFSLVVLSIGSAKPHGQYPSFSDSSSRIDFQNNKLTVTDTVIYNTGYYSVNSSSWVAFNFSTQVDEWLYESASIILPNIFHSGDEHHIIMYSCEFQPAVNGVNPGSYDCHGRNNNENGFWQLYVIGSAADDVEITASSFQSDAKEGTHPPANVIDEDITTRWSSNGKGEWIVFDYGTPVTLDAVNISFHNGNTRQAFFDLEYSADGEYWFTLQNNYTSSGLTLEKELFIFPQTLARYFRLVANGNSVSDWNSYTEIQWFLTTESSSPPISESSASLLIDFGDVPTNTNNWNSMTTVDGSISLIDENGVSTSASLHITEKFLSSLGTGVTSTSLNYPSTVSSDNFRVSRWHTNPRFELRGLEPNTNYDLTFFGTQKAYDNTDRIIRFKAGDSFVDLKTADNTGEVAMLSVISSPTGVIEIIASSSPESIVDQAYISSLIVKGGITYSSSSCMDSDADGFPSVFCQGIQADCDDTNNRIYPTAVEICDDGIDNNCNDLIDSAESSCSVDATCFDNIKNQEETRVDCGGPCADCITLPVGSCRNIPPDRPLRILFLGNSFTGTGPIPPMFRNIVSESNFMTPEVSYNILGGQHLGNHRVAQTSLQLVDQGNWDYVVLQDFRRAFSATPETMKADIAWFYDRVKKTSSDAYIVVFETWAYHSSSDYVIYGFGGSTSAMQEKLRNEFNDAAYNYVPTHATYSPATDILVAPVGSVWEQHLSEANPLTLHHADGYHPAIDGSRLSALVFYSTIYQTTVSDLPDSYSGANRLQASVDAYVHYDCNENNPDSEDSDQLPVSNDECAFDYDCDDDKSNTLDTCSGSPKKCSYVVVGSCVNYDRVCPSGCTESNDVDCMKSSLDVPYTVKSADDYANKKYFNPNCQSEDGCCGEGTLSCPYESLSDIGSSLSTSNTAYLLKRGTTDNMDISFTIGGSNILVGAYGIGDRSKVRTTKTGTGDSTFFTVNGNDITIRDLDISAPHFASSIKLTSYAEHIIIFNNSLSDGGWGVRSYAKHIRFLYNEVFNTKDDGLYFLNNEYVEIGYNYIHHVNQNWVGPGTSQYDAAGDGIQLEPVKYWWVHHNLIDRSDSGNKFSFIAKMPDDSTTNYFEHNTIISPIKTNQGGSNFYSEQGHVVIRYNTFRGEMGPIYSHSNLDIYGNDIYGSSSITCSKTCIKNNNAFYD